MGSLAKKLGQLSSKSLESESSQILRTIQSNKIPNSLSQRLDTTLKDSHDMKVFGLGTLSSMSSIDRYARFTHSMYGIYSTMERELDKTSNIKEEGKEISSSSSPAVKHFWNQHESILRRSEKLRKDLQSIGKNDIDQITYSPETLRYIHTIQEAGKSDRETGGARLLGHAYTRYLADLMGGQVLGTPTRMALALQPGTPMQYSFDFIEQGFGNRKEYVDQIYHDFNTSGRILCNKEGMSSTSNVEEMENESSDNNESNATLEEVVEEARVAFRHNIEVYSEEPIYKDSLVGMKNIVCGWVMRR